MSLECLNVNVQVERPASPVSQLPPVPPRLDLLQQRSSCSHAASGQGAAAKVISRGHSQSIWLLDRTECRNPTFVWFLFKNNHHNNKSRLLCMFLQM